MFSSIIFSSSSSLQRSRLTYTTDPRSHWRLLQAYADGGSFILSLQRMTRLPPGNPTNAVGGSFILSLQRMTRLPPGNPTNAVGGSFILSLQRTTRAPAANPTNAVGGSFILSLKRELPPRFPATQLVESTY